MSNCIDPNDILEFYRQNMSGRGRGGWQALAEILGTSRGAVWEIAHGKRQMTDDQELRWVLYRNIDNPLVTVKRILTCPTCGQLHQVGDCHGQAGAVAILPPGARIVTPAPPRKRKRYRTMRYPPEWDITPAQARQIISDWLTQQSEEIPCSVF